MQERKLDVRKRRGPLLVGVVTVAALAVSGCGNSSAGEADSADKLKVAVVYDTAMTNDYTKAQQEGILNAIDAVGEERIDLTEVESVPYTEQLTQIVTQLFAQGNDVVVDGMGGGGQLFFDGCASAPDQKCIAYYPTPVGDMPENTWGYYSSYWQAHYLEGMAAGLLTETNTIGWVGSFEGSSDNSALNSYVLGCQSVNPQCRARVIYANSYFNPPKAQEAATALVNAGADVLNGYQSDATIPKMAQRHSVWGFGMYRPQGDSAPDRYVSSWLLGPVVASGVEQGLESILDGTFESEFQLISPSGSDALPLDAWGRAVPESVRTEVAGTWTKMQAGENVFVGPIKDTDGVVRIPAGEHLDDSDIYDKWDWQVDGVLR